MPKYFHSNMPGAPVYAGVAGAFIALADACLKDGFGLVTMDSLVIAGGIGTLTRSAGITFERDAVVLLAGITGGAAALNGDRTLLSVTATTATFDATGIANQTATGSITAKMSPLGWLKPFSGTNLAVYKPSDVTAFGQVFRVDDTGTTNARVVGYESMSDINTGLGKFPTEAQSSGGGYWEKAAAAGATARNWILIGDEKFFYFWCGSGQGVAVTSQGTLRGFGDFVARSSTDNYATLLCCAASNLSASTGNVPDLSNSLYAANVGNFFLSRSFSTFGGAAVGGICAESLRGAAGTIISGQSSLVSPYPNTPDNMLDLDRVYARDYDFSIRGRLPGLYHVPQNVGFAFATWDKLDGQGDLAGRRLLAVRCGPPGGTQNSISAGLVFFDLTGPWR